jgi:hypothetical protein
MTRVVARLSVEPSLTQSVMRSVSCWEPCIRLHMGGMNGGITHAYVHQMLQEWNLQKLAFSALPYAFCCLAPPRRPLFCWARRRCSRPLAASGPLHTRPVPQPLSITHPPKRPKRLCGGGRGSGASLRPRKAHARNTPQHRGGMCVHCPRERIAGGMRTTCVEETALVAERMTSPAQAPPQQPGQRPTRLPSRPVPVYPSRRMQGGAARTVNG